MARTLQRKASDGRLAEPAYLILGYVESHAGGVHGYRLGRLLSRSPLGLPSLRLGQLYRILQQLRRRGLVERRLEVSSSGPSRFLFRTTRNGSAAFVRWLGSPPRGSSPVREQLLYRLHFADLVPQRALRRFLHEAARECDAELAELQAAATSTDDPARDGKALISIALEKRLVADRAWLTEVERRVQHVSPATIAARAGTTPMGRSTTLDRED